MDKRQIYNRLDSDESLTDQERRENYYSEVDSQNDYEDWCDEQSGF